MVIGLDHMATLNAGKVRPVLPDGLNHLAPRTNNSHRNNSEYVISMYLGLKMLSILSLTNFIGLQTRIFLFSILISYFKEHSVDLFQAKISI